MSRAVGSAVAAPLPTVIHQAWMRAFVRLWKVNVGEAELPVDQYATFQEFFTRRLKPGSRPLDQGDNLVLSPVDAQVAAIGRVSAGQLLQAKGSDFSLGELLGDFAEAGKLNGGAFVTLYLSPRDYHRIHSPVDGQVEHYRYIPGDLFPVNSLATRWIPNLFCTNERLISFLSCSAGRVAVVKVGALHVGRIRLSFDVIATNSAKSGFCRHYEDPIGIEKGEELGWFELGSTVVLVFEPGRVELDSGLQEGALVRVGQAIGKIISSS